MGSKKWAEYRKLISNSRRNGVLQNTFQIYRLVTNLTAYPSKIIQTYLIFTTKNLNYRKDEKNN